MELVGATVYEYDYPSVRGLTSAAFQDGDDRDRDKTVLEWLIHKEKVQVCVKFADLGCVVKM